MHRNPHPPTGLSISARRLCGLLLVGLCFLAALTIHAATTTLSYDASGNTAAQQAAVAGLPVILAQPVNRLAEANGHAGFSVNVTSDSPVSYQWQFNTTNIPGATGDSLYLPTVTAANAGSYRVIITNATGSITSTAATFSIDANGNGMADAWELLYFGNLNQLPLGDNDGDGISNLDEFLNGTNPTVREVYYWVAASGDFNTAANWSRNRVPGVGDTAVIASGTFILPSSGTLAVSQVTVSVPYAAATGADTTLNFSGAWTFSGGFTLTAGRTFTITGGGSVTVTGTATITGANLVAANASTLSLPAITSYAIGGANNLAWSAQSNGSQLIFPNLTAITGTPAPNRYFDVIAQFGTALVSLPALTSIVKSDDGDAFTNSGVRFYAQNGGTISAPLLATFNDNDSHPNSSLNATTGSAVTVPQLLAPRGVNIALTALSNPQQFTSLVNASSLEITAGVVTMSNLTSIAGLSITATNGATLSLPAITSYAISGPNNVSWAAQHNGSQLIFPNLIMITGTPAPNRYFDLITQYGTALLSLPALTSITKSTDGDTFTNSGVRFFARDGGTISAPVLATFNDNDPFPNSSLNAYTTSAITVPQLLAPRGVNLALNALSNPQQFTSLVNASSLEITAGVVTMSNLTSIAGLSVLASGGSTLSLPAITSYVISGPNNLAWTAQNNGSQLIFPNLTAITGTPAPGRNFDVVVQFGTALVSLPALTSIVKSTDGDTFTNSGVRFYARDGGTISAPLLATFQDNDPYPNSSLNAVGTSAISVAGLRLSGIRGVTLSGVVLPGDVPVITSNRTARAVAGNAFIYQITADNLPTSFNSANLPAGFSIDPASGVISGTPAGIGSFAVTISATNTLGTDSTVLSLIVSTADPILVPTGIAAWWPGQDSSLDIVGTNHGTPANGAGYAAGKVARAFSFDGVDDRVSIPEATATDLSRKPAWTIEAWVRPTSFTGQTYPTIYSEGSWRASLGINRTTGKLESWINNANPLVGTVALQLNAWNHVALTYDGINRKFYVNGVFAGSGSAPAITPDDLGAAIGDVASSPGSSRFAGQIDEVSIYSRSLAAAEIAAIFSAGTAGKALSLSPSPTITNGSDYAGTVGSAFLFQITASNGPSVFSASDLPAGLSVNAATGLIGGTPTVPGTYRVTLGVGNAGGTDSKTLSLTIAGPSDFNADGRSDVFWQNLTTGLRGFWTMNGTAQTGPFVTIGVVPGDWTIAGTGDFNADGKLDLLWRNATGGQVGLWLMNGAVQQGGFIVLGTMPSAWEVAGVGDFNTDGKPDIVWQSTTTGQRGVWFLNGTTHDGNFTAFTTIPPSWTISLVADFNGDNKPDLLWTDTASGLRGFWLMDGLAQQGAFVVLAGVPVDWVLAQAGDFNADGKTDIVWSNTTTGQRGIWLLDGTTPISAFISLPTVPTEFRLGPVK